MRGNQTDECSVCKIHFFCLFPFSSKMLTYSFIFWEFVVSKELIFLVKNDSMGYFICQKICISMILMNKYMKICHFKLGFRSGLTGRGDCANPLLLSQFMLI